MRKVVGGAGFEPATPAARIDTVASREKLKPRREPYWQRVRKGCFVGYRKMTASGHGAWLARARDEADGSKQLFKPLDRVRSLRQIRAAPAGHQVGTCRQGR
jgi:hypothetical protein